MSGTETITKTDTEIKTLADGSTEFVDTKTEVISGDGMTTETVTVSSTVIDPPTEAPEIPATEVIPEIVAEIVAEEKQEIEPWQTLQTQINALQLTQAATLSALESLTLQIAAQQTPTPNQSASVDDPVTPKLPPETGEPLEVPTPDEEKKPEPKAEKKPKAEPEQKRRRWL